MSYSIFASFYDALTENVEYDKRAEYISSLIGEKKGSVLDLCCGTGSLTVRLCKKGYDLIGVDFSPEMLSVARNKLIEWEAEALLLCQDMSELDLYDTVDACVCSLDSLNHITNEKKLEKVFKRVSLFLNKGGLFVFDMNTLYKHRNILGDNVFVYETDEAFCVWQNELLENDIVSINLDIFQRQGNNYKRLNESFCERAYTFEQLYSIFSTSSFELVSMFDELTFDPPHEKSERIFYVLRKI